MPNMVLCNQYHWKASGTNITPITNGGAVETNTDAPHTRGSGIFNAACEGTDATSTFIKFRSSLNQYHYGAELDSPDTILGGTTKTTRNADPDTYTTPEWCGAFCATGVYCYVGSYADGRKYSVAAMKYRDRWSDTTYWTARKGLNESSLHLIMELIITIINTALIKES